MRKVIPADIINVLGTAPQADQSAADAPQPKSNNSFWSRIGNFFKKAATYVAAIITVAISVLDAASRFVHAKAHMKTATAKAN